MSHQIAGIFALLIDSSAGHMTVAGTESSSLFWSNVLRFPHRNPFVLLGTNKVFISKEGMNRFLVLFQTTGINYYKMFYNMENIIMQIFCFADICVRKSFQVEFVKVIKVTQRMSRVTTLTSRASFSL